MLIKEPWPMQQIPYDKMPYAFALLHLKTRPTDLLVLRTDFDYSTSIFTC